jgi:hypothetical protein
MEGQTANIFMETVARKLEQQERTLGAIEKKLDNLPGENELLTGIRADLESIKAGQLPLVAVRELSDRIAMALTLLSKPVENKLVHEHHVPRLLWATAGLFLALCLACCGWYNTGSKLGSLKASDLKYRYLKQQSGPETLRSLYTLDSLYRSGYAMRDSVEKWEANAEKLAELQQKLKVKAKENEQLRKQEQQLRRKSKERNSKYADGDKVER